ncbi:DUF2892 domain-containing protein [Niallia sp. NCCP-28]|uniref:YgaP family membrane protein n=1 Tax=Niallia sp. NCCP-28 TaxID=2934712 RepID=UPI002081BAC5|nr:DUF2892 domain-containing protein [Niallia sp. NCCP-28]GKU84512.1 hypothetical protein NCCP28_39080 [Niallia sp. NCCP-28]
MNPKSNISLINALIRITCGFTFLAWSTAKLSKKPHNQSYLWIALLAGMKIAEGITRYCPLVALYDKKEEFLPNKQTQPAQNHKHEIKEKNDHVEAASSKEVAKIMEDFNPEKIFSPEDMKKD